MAMLLLAVWLPGCTTVPEADWNARLGTYTRDQAIADLGLPSRAQRLSDGSQMLEWVRSRGAQSGLTAQPVTRESIYNDAYRVNAPSRILQLTFGPDDRLVDWTRNY